MGSEDRGAGDPHLLPTADRPPPAPPRRRRPAEFPGEPGRSAGVGIILAYDLGGDETRGQIVAGEGPVNPAFKYRPAAGRPTPPDLDPDVLDALREPRFVRGHAGSMGAGKIEEE